MSNLIFFYEGDNYPVGTLHSHNAALDTFDRDCMFKTMDEVYDI